MLCSLYICISCSTLNYNNVDILTDGFVDVTVRIFLSLSIHIFFFLPFFILVFLTLHFNQKKTLYNDIYQNYIRYHNFLKITDFYDFRKINLIIFTFSSFITVSFIIIKYTTPYNYLKKLKSEQKMNQSFRNENL